MWYASPYGLHIAPRFALSTWTLMLGFCSHFLCRNMGSERVL
jgi:hypothetical protein